MIGSRYLLAATVLVAPSLLQAQSLSPTEQRIVRHVDAHVEEALAFLERTVNVNSGTLNLQGVRDVGRLYEPEFRALGFETRWIEMPDSVNRAGHLFAERRGNRGKRLLLIGHLDTVFEPDSPFQRFIREDSIARGPGVEDMKGGNAIILYALKALDSVGALDGTTITVALIGDEESSGEPKSISRGDLIEAGKRSDVALGFEGSTALGEATTARRGIGDWRLTVTARSGHSSLVFKEQYGAGAIFEAARILDRFYNELRGEQYLTFNPSVIVGGTQITYDPEQSRGTAFGKTNVIPESVVVEGDLRFISPEQQERARERMRSIVSDGNLPHTSATIEFFDGYPAMAPTAENQQILELLDRVSRDLGSGPVQGVDPGERGAADISWVAPYVAGIDGLGALGSGGHTVEERITLSAFPVMIKRAALLIYRLTR